MGADMSGDGQNEREREQMSEGKPEESKKLYIQKRAQNMRNMTRKRRKT